MYCSSDGIHRVEPRRTPEGEPSAQNAVKDEYC
jgi:hypothetical protein